MLNKSFGFKHCIALHFEIATPVCALARNDTALGFLLFRPLTWKSVPRHSKNAIARQGNLLEK